MAWLGLVMMGVAHAATAPIAAARQAPSAAMSSHALHHATMVVSDSVPDAGCGMTFGCHCGVSCYGVVVPFAPTLAHVPATPQAYAPGVQPVPLGTGEPPLHPPPA